MGLVIEPVRQRRRQLLLEFLRRRDAAIFDRACDAPVVEPLHKIDDPPVLGLARGTQGFKGLEQDRVQPGWCVALAGEPLIQTRSVTSRWFRVPCTDLKKAPRSA